MSRRYEPTCFVESSAKVYHRIGKIDGEWNFKTACGRKLDKLWGINSIDRPRADLLGRPCGKCFGGEPT